MTEFSPANVAKARARIPETASRTLQEWMARARSQNLADDFVDACQRELDLRGPLELSNVQADQHATWAQATQAMTLEEAIVFAFTQRPANRDERSIVRQMVENDRPSYSELARLRGKGDVALILGHFVYERFGCFKPWITDAKRMSDILFVREDGGPSVRYRLTPEARWAFEKLGLT